MLKMTWFETETDLRKLTGLTHEQLWDAGFCLDDWDFGIRCNRRLHDDPTRAEMESGEHHEGELVVNWDKEGYWLLTRMQDYCVGASYVKYGRWHYYLVHHA